MAHRMKNFDDTPLTRDELLERFGHLELRSFFLNRRALHCGAHDLVFELAYPEGWEGSEREARAIESQVSGSKRKVRELIEGSWRPPALSNGQ